MISDYCFLFLFFIFILVFLLSSYYFFLFLLNRLFYSLSRMPATQSLRSGRGIYDSKNRNADKDLTLFTNSAFDTPFDTFTRRMSEDIAPFPLDPAPPFIVQTKRAFSTPTLSRHRHTLTPDLGELGPEDQAALEAEITARRAA